MKIIILGSGQVGKTVAEYLLTEDNDITVVDNNKLRLFRLQDRLDLRVVLGCVGYPEVLREAGAEESDILIAATDSDEMNIMACQMTCSFFSIPKCIASIQSTDYMEIEDKIFSKNKKYINYFIHPQKMIINGLINFIKYPGILKIIYLLDGNIVLALFRVSNNSHLVDASISDIKNRIASITFSIPIIVRKKIPFFPINSTILKKNDEFLILCLSKNFLKLIKNFKNFTQVTNRNIVLLGGGNIGFGIARSLEKKYNVTVIESNKKRAKKISKYLKYATVLFGNVSDIGFFSEVNINNIDVFISVTNNDEINIISAIIAKKMLSKQSLSLVKNEFYLNLINFSKIIDEFFFPQEVMISELLNKIRSSNIISLFFFQIGKIEVIEIIIRKKNNTNCIIGSLLTDIKLPSSIMIFAVIRYNNFIFSKNHFYGIRIKEEDHIILLSTDRKNIKVIEKLF
ncbi:Trk system potassium transporter TrkA [Buchnera aphidicola]|uniref:Trk system potassium transporter TrkA n=1 Tax=Buchnera aphidicola TaxID=9 RepID=UPI0034639661